MLFQRFSAFSRSVLERIFFFIRPRSHLLIHIQQMACHENTRSLTLSVSNDFNILQIYFIPVSPLRPAASDASPHFLLFLITSDPCLLFDLQIVPREVARFLQRGYLSLDLTNIRGSL
jgi:hypothetical protein